MKVFSFVSIPFIKVLFQPNLYYIVVVTTACWPIVTRFFLSISLIFSFIFCYSIDFFDKSHVSAQFLLHCCCYYCLLADRNKKPTLKGDGWKILLRCSGDIRCCTASYAVWLDEFYVVLYVRCTISRVEEGKWAAICSVRHSTLVSLQTFLMHMDLLDVE